MKKIISSLCCACIVAASCATEPPHRSSSECEGLTETEMLKRLGPPDLTTNHSAKVLYANAEKSSPIAKALAEFIRQSPDKDIQIKTIAWQKGHFRMARMVQKGEDWVVLGVEELPAGWGEERRTPKR